MSDLDTAASRSSRSAVRSRRGAGKILPEHARAHNRSLVMRALFHGGAMSRADLARETALTRVTISDLVGGLIADGLVVEQGMREGAGPGKPAMLVDLDRAGHRIVGLDLSGSAEFAGAVLTLDGEVEARASVLVPTDSQQAVDAVVALARTLVTGAAAPVLGIGVGTPGVVDDAGVVLAAPGLGWDRLDLGRILGEAVGRPVIVANDANAAVLAERTLGGASDDIILVRVGRGVGAGLLAGGEPLRGARSAAGEIGHVTVGTDGDPECACGRTGCLEAWISVPALSARIDAGDAVDRDGLLRDAGERLGIALAPIVGALDLSEVVLSGPPELLGGTLARAAAETVRTRTLARFHDELPVRMTGQGADIVLRGAAVMVLSARLGIA